MWQGIHGFTDDGTITATNARKPAPARRPPSPPLPRFQSKPRNLSKQSIKAKAIAPCHAINKLPPRDLPNDYDSSDDSDDDDMPELIARQAPDDDMPPLVVRAPDYAEAYEPHPPLEAAPLAYAPPAVVTPQPFTVGPLVQFVHVVLLDARLAVSLKMPLFLPPLPT